MAKKFTTKELRKRSRAKVRRRKLKYNPPVIGRVVSLEEQNKPILDKLEATLKA